MKNSEIDKSKIDNIEFTDIEMNDHPDYSNAHILSADHLGIAMTEKEINELNEDSDFVHEELMNQLS